MLTDHRGNDQGSLSVVLTPCTKKGSPLGDDYFVEDPKELLDKGICLIIPTRDFLVAPRSTSVYSTGKWSEKFARSIWSKFYKGGRASHFAIL